VTARKDRLESDAGWLKTEERANYYLITELFRESFAKGLELQRKRLEELDDLRTKLVFQPHNAAAVRALDIKMLDILNECRAENKRVQHYFTRLVETGERLAQDSSAA
jgi:hypothetical protein